MQMKEEEDSRLGHVQHKYKLLTQRFQNLQRNVHKLLSFIVPDVDLGAPDEIEHIVTEMIRVNCNQSLESSWLVAVLVTVMVMGSYVRRLGVVTLFSYLSGELWG